MARRAGGSGWIRPRSSCSGGGRPGGGGAGCLAAGRADPGHSAPISRCGFWNWPCGPPQPVCVWTTASTRWCCTPCGACCCWLATLFLMFPGGVQLGLCLPDWINAWREWAVRLHPAAHGRWPAAPPAGGWHRGRRGRVLVFLPQILRCSCSSWRWKIGLPAACRLLAGPRDGHRGAVRPFVHSTAVELCLRHCRA